MSGKNRPQGDEKLRVITEIIDGHSVRVEYLDADEAVETAPTTPRQNAFDDEEAPTTPRQEALGLALGLKLQASVDNVNSVLTSLEGVQSTWGRVEAMMEIRKIRSLLDVLEDLIRRHG